MRAEMDDVGYTAFKVQSVDGVRLSRNSEGALLHNTKTGEVVQIEEAKSWAWLSLEVDASQNIVLQHGEGEGTFRSPSGIGLSFASKDVNW